MKFSFFFVIILCAELSSVRAQLNLYSRLDDPRALTYLYADDSGQLQYKNGLGIPNLKDTDNFGIIAADTGSGIITHIWMTFGSADSLTRMKIYIDGSLILSGRFDSVLTAVHGFMRPPLDMFYPVAYVADVQMPYRRSFKITFDASDNNVFYAVAWRHINDSSVVPPFTFFPPDSVIARQVEAEKRLLSLGDPWKDSLSVSIDSQFIFAAKSRTAIFDLSGEGMIRSLHLALDRYDTVSLDSLWLHISWDNSLFEAVNVPLGDFFCVIPGSIPFHSVEMQWDSASGLTSYFPMPFETHAKIAIENRSSLSVHASRNITFHQEKINRKQDGYFYAEFNESSPTRYHIFHPVLHTKGRGRYVGTFLAIPGDHHPVALEGDPIFMIDSLPKYSFEYTGTEDYFNGGFYFGFQTFSKPLSGHTKLFEAFHHFHILDAIDFTSSLDFKLQHGTNTDVREHYRTVAYYYKQTPGFWVSRDTIRNGELLRIGGEGYIPNSMITAVFNDNSILMSAVTDRHGAFDTTFIVRTTSAPGPKKVSINNEIRPESLYLLGSAAVRPIADSLSVTLRLGDSLLVSGTGFIPGEKNSDLF